METPNQPYLRTQLHSSATAEQIPVHAVGCGVRAGYSAADTPSPCEGSTVYTGPERG
jgi:hypothetical protein